MKRWLLVLALASRVALAQTAGAPDAGASPPDAGVREAHETTTSVAALPPAEPISFKSAVEKAEVTLGEPFHLTIEVRHSAKEKYSLPTDLHFKDFEIREHSSEEHGQDPQTTLFRLTLQAFNLGSVEIPAIHLLAQTPDGDRQLEIPPQKIKVNGVIDLSQGQPQLREDARPLPTRYRFVWWPLVLMLAALIGLAGGFYLVRRAKRPPAPPPAKPRLPPYEEAVERLLALQQQNLVIAGQKQAYYFRLSEIVRDYLGRIYSFEALELTSDELLHELRQRPTPGLDYDRFAAFIQEGDLVKFAKSEPTDGECKTAMDLARTFVERTRPLPEAANLGRTA